VPGLHPHPIRDREGHSHIAGREEEREPGWDWDPASWKSLPDWLYGVDLFNAFYFWEAHETWERLWSVKPRHTRPAVFLQGLIQGSAAMLKIHLRSVDGAARLSRQGLDKLARSAQSGRHLMGLDLDHARGELERYFRPLRERTLPPLDASVPVLALTGESDA
jgi:hypothetical protein